MRPGKAQYETVKVKYHWKADSSFIFCMYKTFQKLNSSQVLECF